MPSTFFQSPIYINGNILPISLGGQNTIAVNIIGTISAGYLTPQVSNDGLFWQPIDTLASNYSGIIALNTDGLYIASVAGWQQFRLLASPDFSASCTTQYSTFAPEVLTQIVNNSGNIANNWTAGTYPPNSVVIYNGTFWSNTLSTSGIPGVSGWNNYATLADLLTFILSN